jgi:hypothetical protein
MGLDATQQMRPCHGTADLRFDRFEQTVDTSVQGDVLRRLPVRSMWHRRELPGALILYEATVSPKPIVPAIAKIPIGPMIRKGKK